MCIFLGGERGKREGLLRGVECRDGHMDFGKDSDLSHTTYKQSRILTPKYTVVGTMFLRSFQLYRGGQCTYPYFPGAFTSTPNNILSKPLAAFPHNHCRKDGQQ